MDNKIAKRFSFIGLIMYSIPAIIMLIFTSLYTMVDGMFISRFVDHQALSAVNIILPLEAVICGVGIMLGTGGSAIVGKLLGEGEEKKARNSLTIITIFGVIIAAILTVIVLVFIEPIMSFLGADDVIMDYCVDYGRIAFAFTIPYIIQLIYNYLFLTAGKTKLALAITILGGVINVILDYLFIVRLDMGIKGAAWGTIVGRVCAAAIAIGFFLKTKGVLRFTKPKWQWSTIINASTNGFSEMVTNLAMSVTTFLFNNKMMSLLGADGVAAISIVLYSQFVFTAIFMGFCGSVSPVISYNYGRGDKKYLKKIILYSNIFIFASAIIMVITSILNADIVVELFADKGSYVYGLAYSGFMLYLWNFLFAGPNIFCSAMFTAFSNGKVSALVSFLRTFIFLAGGILIFSAVWGVDGLWLATPIAEFMTLIVVIVIFIKHGKKYGYIG